MPKLSFNDIRAKSAWVCGQAEFVSIHEDRLEDFARLLQDTDGESWSASLPVKLQKTDFENELRFALLFSVTCYCFWQEPKWGLAHEGKTLGGAFSLGSCYAIEANKNRDILLPESWLELNVERLQDILTVQSGALIPFIEERVASLHQAGRLIAQYNNSMQDFVAAHDCDAEQILNAFTASIDSFNDVHDYRGQKIPFAKTAQLAIADMASLYLKHGGKTLANVNNMTACADYKMPQLMRHYGLLAYDEVLAKRIDAKQELSLGEKAEIEIRAANVHLVELLRPILAQRQQKDLTAKQVNDQIWLLSQRTAADMKPHHRTATIYY